MNAILQLLVMVAFIGACIVASLCLVELFVRWEMKASDRDEDMWDRHDRWVS